MTTVDIRPASRRRAPAPRMEVLASFDAASTLREEWNELAAGLRAPVYMSFEHCEVWWSRYGAGRDLHLMAFRADGELVAVVPFFSERVWLGPVALLMAGIVGSDFTPVVLDLPVRAGYARDVFAAAMKHLLGGVGCDAVKFAPLSGESVHADAVRAAAEDVQDLGVIARDAVIGPHTVFDLPATFDGYLGALDKKQRARYRHGMQVLEDDHGVTVDVVSDPERIEAEFPVFRDMHERQWRAVGKLGHFRDWPLSEEYHADLLRAHAPRGRAHLLRMLVAGEPVSYELCYSFGETLHWVLPARAMREDLERHSLGRLGFVRLVGYAIGAGFRRIEGGVGHYDYKLQLGATEHRAWSIVVAGGVAKARLNLFARLATALDTIYYRAWFKHIAPRLPLPQAPLWDVWIRSRL